MTRSAVPQLGGDLSPPAPNASAPSEAATRTVAAARYTWASVQLADSARTRGSMMRGFVGGAFVGLVGLVACEEAAVDGSSCPDISGNYSVTVERLSGTCDPALDPKTASVSVTKGADGTWTLVAPGLEGGCPGTLDEKTCKLTSQCVLLGTSGETLGTFTVDYAFTSAGYCGTSVSGLRTPAVETPCDVTYRETGTKL